MVKIIFLCLSMLSIEIRYAKLVMQGVMKNWLIFYTLQWLEIRGLNILFVMSVSSCLVWSKNGLTGGGSNLAAIRGRSIFRKHLSKLKDVFLKSFLFLKSQL